MAPDPIRRNAPPPFGHALLAEFNLEPETLYLNHGAFGATPKSVLAAEQAWRDRLERNPTRFFQEELPALLRHLAAEVARRFGGRGEDWVLVDNATAGVNAVIGSLRLAPGDELVTTSHVYGAVRQTLLYHAGRAGAVVREIPLPLPSVDDDAVVDAVAAALTPATRFAVFDHVTSPSATILPVARLARLCRERGIAVLIDGAHAPGMLPLDVPAIGADWYTGNAHKWLFAPKVCGLLWCAPQHQASLHPTAISHYLGQGMTAEFDWTGTRDVAPWLALEAAFDFFDRFGWAAVREHNHALAVEAGRLLAAALGTEVAAPPAMLGAMASVRLPIVAPDADRQGARALQSRLRERHRIEAPVLALGGHYWLRVSAQIYNERGDYERLAALAPAIGTEA